MKCWTPKDQQRWNLHATRAANYTSKFVISSSVHYINSLLAYSANNTYIVILSVQSKSHTPELHCYWTYYILYRFLFYQTKKRLIRETIDIKLHYCGLSGRVKLLSKLLCTLSYTTKFQILLFYLRLLLISIISIQI